jgi:hypothetical protein
VGLAALVVLVTPGQALALRAANYGYDWAASPFNNIDLFDAASRSAYYQELDGYTTMNRDRGLGVNIYDKLAGTDANTYQVINVISHGNESCIACRPHDTDGYMSCLYEDVALWGAHSHEIDGVQRNCVSYRRVQSLPSVPTVRWAVFQGCETARQIQFDPSNLTKAANAAGVDTAVGFTGDIYIGPGGSNGKSFQYNFAARYWKSLYEGAYNSKAMDDGTAQVLLYHGTQGGYQTHARYGLDAKL